MIATDLKTIWKHSIENNIDDIIDSDYIKVVMEKSHSRTVSKLLNELKLKMVLYSFSLLVLLGLIFYAFVYLELEIHFSFLLPFMLGGLLMALLLLSSMLRFGYMNKRFDDYSLKDSVTRTREQLKKIRTFDVNMSFVLCYGIASFYIIAYAFNNNNFKGFFQSNNMAIILYLFIAILLFVPWIVKSTVIKRYNISDMELLRSMEYYK